MSQIRAIEAATEQAVIPQPNIVSMNGKAREVERIDVSSEVQKCKDRLRFERINKIGMIILSLMSFAVAVVYAIYIPPLRVLSWLWVFMGVSLIGAADAIDSRIGRISCDIERLQVPKGL